jgi:hypothetical protein
VQPHPSSIAGTIDVYFSSISGAHPGLAPVFPLFHDRRMVEAEFEEKQYETALIFDLQRGQPRAFSAGQVLEALVGYDVALRLQASGYGRSSAKSCHLALR